MEAPPSSESSRQCAQGVKRPREESETHSADEHSVTAPAEFVDVDNINNNGDPSSKVKRTLVFAEATSAVSATGNSPPPARPVRSPAVTAAEADEAVGATGGGGTATLSEHRRMKQPTLAIYGMVNDTARLKKELLDKEAQVSELRERLTAVDEELARRDTQLDFLEERTQLAEQKLARFQDVLREEMLHAAQQGKAEARRVLHQRHFELGQIATWPGNGREVWVEGNTMKNLIMQLEEVTKRRDEVEGLKKLAQSSLKQLTKQEREREESTGSPEVLDAFMEAQEQVQLRSAEHAALSNTIAIIKQRQAELENEKKAFLKEIRRLNDEDASEFMAVSMIGEGDRYVLMNLLGKGGFSEVWRAFDLVEGRYVACKIHRVGREWSAATRAHYLRHAERELEIMRHFDHPHLTRLYDVFQHSDTMFVSVMEFSEGMDLDTYLKRYRTLREADARLILLQVVSALRHLASLESPIIHYDLKPANILLHSEDPTILSIKITDFGLSKIIGPTREGPSDNPSIELTSQGTGTYWYLPPECFDTASTPRINSKVDIWSVGVIFYQMLFGRRPFAEGESQRRIWQEKLIVSSARTLRFPETPKVSDEAKELISHCLAFNVNERYDIYQVSHHPYLFRTGRRSNRTRSTQPASALASPLGGGYPVPSALHNSGISP